MVTFLEWSEVAPDIASSAGRKKKRKLDAADSVRHCATVRTSGAQNHNIQLVDTTSGDILATLKGHSEVIYCYKVLKEPELALVSGSLDGTVRIWELWSRRRQGYPISRPGKDAGGWSCTAVLEPRFLRPGGGNMPMEKIQELPNGGGIVVHSSSYVKRSVVFRRVGESPGWTYAATLLTHGSGFVGHLYGKETSVTSSAVLSSELVCAQSDGALQVWQHDGSENPAAWGNALLGDDYLNKSNDLSIRYCPLVLPGHSKRICCLEALPCGNAFLTGSADNTVRVWRRQRREWTCVAVLVDGPPAAPALAGVHPDIAELVGAGGVFWLAVLSDQSVISGSGHDIRVWPSVRQLLGASEEGGTAGGKGGKAGKAGIAGKAGKEGELPHVNVLTRLIGHTGQVTSVAVLPNGAVASGAYDRTVRVWHRSSAGGAKEEGGGGANSAGDATSKDSSKKAAKKAGKKAGKGGAAGAASAASAVAAAAAKGKGKGNAGAAVATADEAGDSGVWRLSATLSGHPNIVWRVAALPDGALASSGGGGAGPSFQHVWELAAKVVDNDPNEAGGWRLRSATTTPDE